jgi:hypothetical protein
LARAGAADRVRLIGIAGALPGAGVNLHAKKHVARGGEAGAVKSWGRGAMEKETFILQVTHGGRLPTNAVFSDEVAARAEMERAQKSGAFQHIRLVQMTGTQKKVLAELGTPPNPKDVPARGKPVKGKPAAPAKKKQVSTAQLLGRVSWLITFLLIAGALYLVVNFMGK